MPPVTGVDANCTGCGAPLTVCTGCGRALDPPRFCPACGHRMTVAVTPGGFRAVCRDHGPLESPAGPAA